MCAIADTGSVHKAARQLGMTQPSLTTQLRRIEQAVGGGPLFNRERTGSRPTPLGRTVLTRARPIVAQMTELIREAKDAAGLGHADPGARLRLGSTGSRAVPGWLRRLHRRLPDTDITFQTDVSANTLLQMVADNQLDAAFVHEVEGAPLRVPDGIRLRVLVRREPQFVAVPATHPAARTGRAVAVAELAGEKWMVDPSVDGDATGTGCAGCSRLRGSIPGWCTATISPRAIWSPPERSSPPASPPRSRGRGCPSSPWWGIRSGVRLVVALRAGRRAGIEGGRRRRGSARLLRGGGAGAAPPTRAGSPPGATPGSPSWPETSRRAGPAAGRRRDRPAERG